MKNCSLLTLSTLTLLHLLLLVRTSHGASATNDEPAHLAAGISYLSFEQFGLYRVNPPLVRICAAIPMLAADPILDWTRYTQSSIVRAEFQVGRDFATANGPRFPELLQLARYAVMPFSLFGLLGCYLWSRALWGGSERAGLLAAALWAFSPSILAHGSLVGCDVPAAAIGVWLGYCFWKFNQSPSCHAAFSCGIFWGFALLIKSTWLLFGPIFLLHVCVSTARLRNLQPLQNAGVTTLVALLILNTGYLFRGTGTALGEIAFISDELTVVEENLRKNRFHDTWIGDIPMPVPPDFILGVDIQRHDFIIKTGGYLAGTISDSGRWYYPLYAAAVKQPVPFLILFLMSIFPVRSLRQRLMAGGWGLILGPFVFLAVLQTSRMDDHFRYVIPALPFAFIWLGSLASWRHRVWRSTAATQIVLCALICATTIPNFLSFFNIAAGGPSRGHTHLLGSDLDWGQGLVQLAAWERQQDLAQPIFLAYHGPVDPSVYGISWTPLRDASPNGGTIPEGVYAISENLLFGDPNAWLVERGSGTSRIKVIPFRNYFLNHQPDAGCGPIRVYKVTAKPLR